MIDSPEQALAAPEDEKIRYVFLLTSVAVRLQALATLARAASWTRGSVTRIVCVVGGVGGGSE